MSICHQFACNRCERMPFKGRFFGFERISRPRLFFIAISTSYLPDENVTFPSAFSLSLSRVGINFLARGKERKYFSIGLEAEIGGGSSRRRLAEVMGAKLFRPFYRGKLAWIHVRAGESGNRLRTTGFSVKLGNKCCHLQMRSRNIARRPCLATAQESVGARAPSANRISPREQRFPLPIPKESNPPFSRNEKLAPGEREFIPWFDRLTRLDRSIKIFHGINVIRYVNKRGRLRTYLVQLKRIRGVWKVSAQFLAKMENSIVSLFLRRVYVTSKRLVHFIIYYISSPFISYLFQRNLCWTRFG